MSEVVVGITTGAQRAAAFTRAHVILRRDSAFLLVRSWTAEPQGDLVDGEELGELVASNEACRIDPIEVDEPVVAWIVRGAFGIDRDWFLDRAARAAVERVDGERFLVHEPHANRIREEFSAFALRRFSGTCEARQAILAYLLAVEPRPEHARALQTSRGYDAERAHAIGRMLLRGADRDFVREYDALAIDAKDRSWVPRESFDDREAA